MRNLPSRKLDRKIVAVWRISALANVLIWAIVAIGTVAAVRFGLSFDASFNQPLVFTILDISILGLGGITVASLIVFAGIVPQIRYLQWSFDVLDNEIDIHKGIFWHKRIIIPLIRVQNVDTKQGPVMRAFGLASITVATAAGEHEIPGLLFTEADPLRDRVALLARIAQEDV
jgi:membrane protein YdbS with pleckstrin-like domain